MEGSQSSCSRPRSGAQPAGQMAQPCHSCRATPGISGKPGAGAAFPRYTPLPFAVVQQLLWEQPSPLVSSNGADRGVW